MAATLFGTHPGLACCSHAANDGLRGGRSEKRAPSSHSHVAVALSFSWLQEQRPCLGLRGNERRGRVQERLLGRTSVPVRCTAVVPNQQEQAVSVGVAPPKKHADIFLHVTTEEELRGAIRKLVEFKAISPQAGPPLEQFYANYRDALISSGRPDAQQYAVQIMGMVFDRIVSQIEDPFTFPSYHVAVREPYDFFAFGNEYIRPLVDYRKSYLGSSSTFDEISDYLEQGHNVVLLSNHQTEADPAVLALMLETTHPHLGQKLTYVAGDRVVHDPQCKPFSMGRNLLCVYSKRHMNDNPDLVDMKQRANRRALVEMTKLFNKGGHLIWIAPSGGRDRPDANDKWRPASFDPSSVELMHRLASSAKHPGHLYPLAILCHDVLPPPKMVAKSLGEERIINFTGVGLSVGPELDTAAVLAGVEDKHEGGKKLTSACFEVVNAHYAVLDRATNGGEGLAASTAEVQLVQPWGETPPPAQGLPRP